MSWQSVSRATSSRVRMRWWRWVPLLLTALTRAVWLAGFPTDPIGQIDPEGFHLLAVNMLDGNGFAIGWEPPFCPTAVRTPLYPFFIAGAYRLFGREPMVVVLLQILFEVLTAAGLMAVGRDLTLSAWSRRAFAGRAGAALRWPFVIVPGMLYAFNGLTPRFTGYLYAENLLLLLMTLALWATIRAFGRPSATRLALAGGMWGTVLLTKPNVQYFVVGVGMLLCGRVLQLGRGFARRRRGAARLASFWLVLGIVAAPWLLRNRLTLGRWVLSTAFEENLARVSAVAVQAELTGVVVEPWTETWEGIYQDLKAQALSRPEVSDDVGDAAACDRLTQAQRWVTAEARRVIREHMGLTVRLHLRGVLRGASDLGHQLWYRILSGHSWATTGVVPNIWARMAWSWERRAVGDALRVFWSQRVRDVPWTAGIVWWTLLCGRLLVWGLALAGLWLLRSRPWAAVLLATTAVYHILLPGPIAHDRFYLPVVVPAVLLVSVGLGQLVVLTQVAPRETVR